MLTDLEGCLYYMAALGTTRAHNDPCLIFALEVPKTGPKWVHMALLSDLQEVLQRVPVDTIHYIPDDFRKALKDLVITKL